MFSFTASSLLFILFLEDHVLIFILVEDALQELAHARVLSFIHLISNNGILHCKERKNNQCGA